MKSASMFTSSVLRLTMQGCILLVSSIYATGMLAQSIDNAIQKTCLIYENAIISTTNDAVPRDLLKDWQVALPCLTQSIKNTKAKISNVQDIPKQKDLLRAEKAIRVILDENGKPAIDLFRSSEENLDVVSVLTLAARSNDKDFRVTSTLILGDVIDNRTVCVPLDHLFANDLSDNGRVNLLAVVSVIIPWAFEENVNNIENATGTLKNSLKGDVADSLRVIDTIDKRLTARKAKLPEDSPPSNVKEILRFCRDYNFQWAKGKFKF